MNPFRHFKTLSPDQLVTLVDETDITGSGATLCVLGLSHSFPADYFETLVSEKRANCVKVLENENPLFRIIFQKVADTTLSILLAQALRSDSADIRKLGFALDKLSAREKCSAVIFSTARHALIEQAREWGAIPFQVWMKKQYTV